MDADIQALLDERARTMAEFTADHRPMQMYAIYRADLEMEPGKLGAQLGHGYEQAAASAEQLKPGTLASYRGTGNGTKIVQYAKNLHQLLRAYREVQAAGIPHCLVIDRGHVLPPHFDGQPIITALVFGPVFKDAAKHITKRYTLTP